jgi:glycosyltransferase involved in cell wall biosynthesis
MKDKTGKTRLALLNDQFFGGGVERMLSYMSCGLFDDDGLIFLFDGSRIDFEYRGRIVELGVKQPPYSGIAEECRQLLRALRSLRRLKRRHAVDVCISHKEGPNLINVLSGRSRAIVTVHELKSSGIKYGGWRRRLVRAVIRHIYNRASFVVTVSRQIAVDLEKNFDVDPRKLRTIYNPCDVDMVRRRMLEPLPDDDLAPIFESPVVISVGRLDRQKGHWHLIRAFAEVRRKLPAARLVILGEGDQREYLQRIIGELGLEDVVHLPGYRANPFQFMRRAKVFALSSLWEGFPAILLEAMACGLPVITTDCPSGPRELLAPETDSSTQCTEIETTPYGVLTARVEDRYPASSEPLTPGESQLAVSMERLLGDDAARRSLIEGAEVRLREFTLAKYIAQWNALVAEAESKS